jgi:hypothetical protein
VTPNEAAALYHRSDRVDETRVGDRIVLYQRDRGTGVVLNPAGSSVWDALSEPKSPQDIVSDLLAQYDGVPPERVAADVDEYLTSLEAQALIRRTE